MTAQRKPNTSSSDPSSPESLISEVSALRQELTTLRAEIAAMRETPVSSPPTVSAIAAMPEGSDRDAQNANVSDALTSRRNLLKWGGLGAAATLAAAGSTALTTPTAHAASGGNLVLGAFNTAESNTHLVHDGSNSGAAAALTVGIGAVAGTAILGGNDGLGTNGIGVRGVATGPAGVGIYGSSDSGFGVVGQSTTGIDFRAAGGGRLWQKLSGSVGAPTSGSYFAGEQIRDNNGDLYLCIVSGPPGTWRKVAAGIPGASGALNFLANPIRLLDTRSGSAWLTGSTHTLQVTGVSIGGISVPAGAIGVIGNVTVVSPSAGGDLRLYPGATAPATSSINFATNQTIANGVTVGLNGSGQLTIKVDMPAGAHTHVLFDASGFVL
jgi:hypothetical protein